MAGASGSAPSGSVTFGVGRSTKYTTRAIVSANTTLSAMMSPRGIVRFFSTGAAAAGFVAEGIAGAGVTDCLMTWVYAPGAASPPPPALLSGEADAIGAAFTNTGAGRTGGRGGGNDRPDAEALNGDAPNGGGAAPGKGAGIGAGIGAGRGGAAGGRLPMGEPLFGSLGDGAPNGLAPAGDPPAERVSNVGVTWAAPPSGVPPADEEPAGEVPNGEPPIGEPPIGDCASGEPPIGEAPNGRERSGKDPGPLLDGRGATGEAGKGENPSSNPELRGAARGAGGGSFRFSGIGKPEPKGGIPGRSDPNDFAASGDGLGGVDGGPPGGERDG